MARLDSVRFEVRAAPQTPTGADFEVLVFVNGAELTSRGAGMGMDPYDVLVPVNTFLPLDEPRRSRFARCTCGVYGCGTTDVLITRDGGLVHWEWESQAPLDRPVVFAETRYQAALDTVGTDWETPDRALGRFLLERRDTLGLERHGLELSWCALHHLDPRVVRICLNLGDTYQVFLDQAWGRRDVETLGRELSALLAQPPHTWNARWHSVTRSTRPPAIAGPLWVPESGW